jgi:hypothetical protein
MCGPFRNTALEHRARVIAAAAMAAARGAPLRPALKNYVTDPVYRRLVFRSRSRNQTPDPGYSGRCFLSAVNSKAVEAQVVVFGGERTRAVAMRLQRENHVWRAVHVTLI